MKQILPRLKQLNTHLSFLRKSFTKRGFRHVTAYINGIITLNKKTVKQISIALVEKESESAINRLLSEARFNQNSLEKRYLKKIKYYTKDQIISLIFDDSLVKREGKKVEETQRHKNHSGDEEFITGHQFFTSLIHTPILQLPLLPKLYSKNTNSKIEMASDLIDFVFEKMKLHNVFMDSWYSDKKIIKKCITKKIRVICGIKTNRLISLEKGNWTSLSDFSNNVNMFDNYYIDEIKYQIKNFIVKLNGIPHVKMLISKEFYEKENKWSKKFHLISTKTNDTSVEIIRNYKIRWNIETYHRDIKQNLGFAKLFLRKKEGIVRHAIFCSIAYAILKMFMFLRGMDMSIGQCIAYVQNKEMDDFILEIIEIEDKETRVKIFEESFKRETAEL